MPNLDALILDLDETIIAKRVGISHDETFARYPLRSNTAKDFNEFSQTIGDYYNYVSSKVLSDLSDTCELLFPLYSRPSMQQTLNFRIGVSPLLFFYNRITRLVRVLPRLALAG